MVLFHRQNAAVLLLSSALYQTIGLTGTSTQAGWRSGAANGYFREKAHFALIAAGANGDIDAG